MTADFLREAKSARFPVRTGEPRPGERDGDGDLRGEPELSDRRDPWSPDPNLWRILLSLLP